MRSSPQAQCVRQAPRQMQPHAREAHGVTRETAPRLPAAPQLLGRQQRRSSQATGSGACESCELLCRTECWQVHRPRPKSQSGEHGAWHSQATWAAMTDRWYTWEGQDACCEGAAAASGWLPCICWVTGSRCPGSGVSLRLRYMQQLCKGLSFEPCINLFLRIQRSTAVQCADRVQWAVTQALQLDALLVPGAAVMHRCCTHAQVAAGGHCSCMSLHNGKV